MHCTFYRGKPAPKCRSTSSSSDWETYPSPFLSKSTKASSYSFRSSSVIWGSEYGQSHGYFIKSQNFDEKCAISLRLVEFGSKGKKSRKLNAHFTAFLMKLMHNFEHSMCLDLKSLGCKLWDARRFGANSDMPYYGIYLHYHPDAIIFLSFKNFSF